MVGDLACDREHGPGLDSGGSGLDWRDFGLDCRDFGLDFGDFGLDFGHFGLDRPRTRHCEEAAGGGRRGNLGRSRECQDHRGV